MNRKRSIVVNQRVTSVSLEDPFWEAVKVMAFHRHMTPPDLVSQIDRRRADDLNLSSAIRIEVLNFFQSKAEAGRAA